MIIHQICIHSRANFFQFFTTKPHSSFDSIQDLRTTSCWFDPIILSRIDESLQQASFLSHCCQLSSPWLCLKAARSLGKTILISTHNIGFKRYCIFPNKHSWSYAKQGHGALILYPICTAKSLWNFVLLHIF